MLSFRRRFETCRLAFDKNHERSYRVQIIIYYYSIGLVGHNCDYARAEVGVVSKIRAHSEIQESLLAQAETKKYSLRSQVPSVKSIE